MSGEAIWPVPDDDMGLVIRSGRSVWTAEQAQRIEAELAERYGPRVPELRRLFDAHRAELYLTTIRSNGPQSPTALTDEAHHGRPLSLGAATSTHSVSVVDNDAHKGLGMLLTVTRRVSRARVEALVRALAQVLWPSPAERVKVDFR
jgi:hypothetical protein